jgi:hypothetical protein
MARPSIAGWRRTRPKGHARERGRRQRHRDGPSVAPGSSRRRAGSARHPGAVSFGYFGFAPSLVRTLLARFARPNVFPTHWSLGKPRQTRREATIPPGAEWDEPRSPEGQRPGKDVVSLDSRRQLPFRPYISTKNALEPRFPRLDGIIRSPELYRPVRLWGRSCP